MRPQFTLVSAVYNVAEYIEAFLASLDRQTYGIGDIEVILVDDGSTDGSGDIARRWMQASAARVQLLRQENAGQGAARNAGLDLATGRWVTFADPDDVLADDYFERVATFLTAQQSEPDLIATRQLFFSEDHAKHEDRHPLRRRFKDDQVVDLSRFPNRIQLSGCSAFFPLDRLNGDGVRFDTRVRPTFEDGHLIGRHLLASRTPSVGFIRSAEYYYRKRVDGSSSVQRGWLHEGKYTDVLRYGFLDLLRRAAERYGKAPQWAQNTVLYDLQWYFKTDYRLITATGSLRPEIQAEFHELCREIFAFIDVETIMGFQISPIPRSMRLELVAGYKDPQMRPDQVRLDSLDPRQRLVRARYTFSGSRPDEAFYWRGRRIEPVHQKVRAVEYLGRAIAYERIVWLPSDGTLRITLDGRPVPLNTQAPSDLPYQLTSARLAQLFDVRPAPQRPGRRARLKTALTAPVRWRTAATARITGWSDREQWTARVARRLAASPTVRNRFRDAWVLMDRQDQAQDNAEHLYRYLRARRPDVNAWFVLDRRSPDWPRLERKGFRLVAYGSMQWRVLLLNARHVVSSHANGFVTHPLPYKLYGAPSWQLTFLQHGIAQNDYSRWLAAKPLALMITTTVAEYQSFVGDGTPYALTTKEVQRTGLPRHDSLLAKARKLAPAEVDRILVMPSWRRSLAEGMPASWNAEERAAAFRESDYAKHWLAVLQAPELRAAAERHGLRVSFLPHPNMTEFLGSFEVPDHVDLLRWADADAQDVFARTKLLVTDYSSIAFEVAYLGRPTVYYQFDRTEFFSGAQPFRRGYFDIERDGFGPVVESHEDAISALEELAAGGFEPSPEVQRRIETTFGERTGDACYRVYKAIVQLDRAVKARPIDGLPVVTDPPMEGLSDAAVLDEAAADGLAVREDLVPDLMGEVDVSVASVLKADVPTGAMAAVPEGA